MKWERKVESMNFTFIFSVTPEPTTTWMLAFSWQKRNDVTTFGGVVLTHILYMNKIKHVKQNPPHYSIGIIVVGLSSSCFFHLFPSHYIDCRFEQKKKNISICFYKSYWGMSVPSFPSYSLSLSLTSTYSYSLRSIEYTL